MAKNFVLKGIDVIKPHRMIFAILLAYVLSLLFTNISIFLGGQRLQISEVFFLFLFFLWIKSLIEKKRLPQGTPLSRSFLLFIAFCLLSFFNSTDLRLSIMELAGLIYLFVMLVLVVDVVNNKRKLDLVIKFWIGATLMVLILGFVGGGVAILTGKANLFCRAYYGNYPYIKTAFRVQSIFHNPLVLANFLTVSLGFMFSDLLLTENQRYKFILKVAISFATLLMLATISREILGFIISLFLIYSYFFKKASLKYRVIRFLLIVFIIIIFLFIFIFCSSFHIHSFKVEDSWHKTYRSSLININYSFSEKLAYKMAALEMLKRHPFLGVGLKMYRPYIQKLNNEDYFYSHNLTPIYYYIYEGRYFNYLQVNDPHNDFLQYFAETGLLGGVAFIIFVATFLSLVHTNLKKRPFNQYFKIRLFCFLASFVGILVHSIDIDVFKYRPVWFLMALTLALIIMSKDKIDAVNVDRSDEKN